MRKDKDSFTYINSDYERFKFGLAYFEDLNTPLLYNEALSIFEIIKKIILDIDKNCVVDIVGGFRRLFTS